MCVFLMWLGTHDARERIEGRLMATGSGGSPPRGLEDTIADVPRQDGHDQA